MKILDTIVAHLHSSSYNYCRRRLEPLFEEDTESGESEEENLPLDGRSSINQVGLSQ